MNGNTILIVDDNQVLCEGLKELLEGDGYHVLTAGNGQEGMEVMERAVPDLILSDITMPVMDGYEFFNRVRQRIDWVSIPFIFLTARREREDIFEGKRLGVEDYLVKPVSRQELVTTIRSRLERSQQLLLAQLRQSYQSSLIMLANAIELRDLYTRGHVERVRYYATIIGEEMGLPVSLSNQLHFGSILHDIGKIHIPESILRKPGPLDDSEWAVMKRHPMMGVELVKDIPYLIPAIPVIHYHHERWDGNGYPDRISGENIPLVARIVAVADSLDAMCTSRPYQEAFSLDQACKEIQNNSGIRYDPQVVIAFNQALDKIKMLINQQTKLNK